MFIVFADERESIVRHESIGYWQQDTMTRGKFECLERVEIGKFDRGKVIGMLYRKGQISERGVFMEGSDFVEAGDETVVEHSVTEAHVAIDEANTMVRDVRRWEFVLLMHTRTNTLEQTHSNKHTRTNTGTRDPRSVSCAPPESL